MNSVTRIAKTCMAIVLLALLVGYGVSAAIAAVPKPLVVIRFNQPNVYYTRPLYNAVSRAVEVKPDVRFDVLAISPLAPSNAATRSQEARTQKQAKEVLQALERMGVPRARIAYTLQHSQAVDSSEVHIFVR